MQPKLLTTLRGYTLSDFRADSMAGLTVAIVALPLAMALGIASGASPDKGLVTAVVAGFLISALGGSRVQVGGPTGAFVVVISGVIADHGYAGDEIETIAGITRAGVRSELLPGSGLRLMDLGAGEALAELEFLFPLGGSRLDAFAQVLAAWPDYARAPAEWIVRRASVRGQMTGYIDLIARWQDRYYVLDYKTNLLGPGRADYAAERLPAAIRAHDYDLQYLIYLVALQRFLRARLGGSYDYEKHIGGALYLFVRGMREGDRAGIHHDRPPAALIDALDAWCEGEAP